MLCLYWKGRMNLWEGDWAHSWFHLLWERDMNLSLCSLSFLGLACRSISYLAPTWGSSNFSVSRFILQTWQKTHPREKDSCILLGFSSWVGSTKAQQKQRHCRWEGRIWFWCSLMLTYFVIPWIVKLQLYHSKRQNSLLQLKRCFPRLWG